MLSGSCYNRVSRFFDSNRVPGSRIIDLNESIKGYLGGIPIRLITTVMVAILIPSVLVTALGLVTVFQADTFVKDFVRAGYRKELQEVKVGLEREWSATLDYFESLLGDANERSAYLGGVRDDPYVLEVFYSNAGGLFQVAVPPPYPELLSNRDDPVLLEAIKMEGVEGRNQDALKLYLPLLLHKDPAVVLGALLGAARTSRNIGNSEDFFRYMDNAIVRFGNTVDGSGMVRKLPLLYQKFKAFGDEERSRASETARTLLLAIEEAGPLLSSEVAAEYRERLSGFSQGAGVPAPGAVSAAGGSQAIFDQAVLESLRVELEKVESSFEAAPPGNVEGVVSHLRIAQGELVFFSVPTGEASFVVHLQLDPSRFLGQLEKVQDELHIPGALLLPAYRGGGYVISPPEGLTEEPHAVEPLPSPLEHLEVRYLPLPGSLPVGFRSFEVLTLATFTWAVILLVVMIIVGVFYILRYVLMETRTSRLKSDFVSFISHELKTPLAAIKMFTETLREGRVSGEEEQRECLELIERESDRLSSLIDKVLAYSRVERDQKVFQFSSCNMADVVDEAIALFHVHTADRPREIKLHSVQEISNIQMDRASMVEVVLNLLSNAEKYSPRDTVIEVNIRETVRDISVEVVDKGVGIPKRDQRRIFEKFFRADDLLTREVEGTGLGLAFSRYIANAHNGDIKVSSQRAAGSVFTLQLKKTHVLAE